MMSYDEDTSFGLVSLLADFANLIPKPLDILLMFKVVIIDRPIVNALEIVDFHLHDRSDIW